MDWPHGKAPISFSVEAGFSYKGADLDNIIKPLLDTFQCLYEDFNDNKVYHIELTKRLVPKTQEYLKITIKEYTDD